MVLRRPNQVVFPETKLGVTIVADEEDPRRSPIVSAVAEGAGNGPGGEEPARRPEVRAHFLSAGVCVCAFANLWRTFLMNRSHFF